MRGNHKCAEYDMVWSACADLGILYDMSQRVQIDGTSKQFVIILRGTLKMTVGYYPLHASAPGLQVKI